MAATPTVTPKTEMKETKERSGRPRRAVSIRHKILWVGLVPLTLAVVLGLRNVDDSLDSRAVARGMQRNAACFQATGDLITELQRERGRTSMFLSGRLSRADLDAQRRQSDSRRAAYADALQASTLDAQARARGGFEQLRLDDLRSSIGTTVRTPTDAIRLYSERIERLSGVLAGLAHAPTTGGVGQVFTSLLVVETAKEHAGILRATAAGIVGLDGPVEQDRVVAVVTLKGHVAANLASRAVALSPGGQTRLADLPARPHWLEIDRIVGTIVAKSRTGGYGIPPEANWAVMTRAIDDLGELVKAETEILVSRTLDLEHRANRSVLWTAAAMGRPLALA